jgi:predicted Rossmann fold flavoprotein
MFVFFGADPESADMVAGTADVVVVGGGAAGLAAAASAAARGRRVVLLEGGDRLGRKILASGNGRCNLTNVDADAPHHYHGGHRGFVGPALQRFPVRATLAWFGRLGLETRQETRGRVFPLSDQARAVVAVLADQVAVTGVSTVMGTRVRQLCPVGEGFEVRTTGATWRCRRVILATGGPSAPRLGADRSGIDLACQLGHHAGPLLPGLVPLVSPDPWVRQMQGARVQASVSAPLDGKRRAQDRGELLFTAYGVSGPVVLNLSAQLVPLLAHGPVELAVDLFPGRSPEDLSQTLQARWEANPHRGLADSFVGLLPDRMAGPLLGSLGLPAALGVKAATKQQRWHLALGLHAWRLAVTAPRPLDFAEVTIGGIRTDEVHPETLESRLVPGLHMAGEMLDVHGDLGGFNLQWAWSSGWSAGQAASP